MTKIKTMMAGVVLLCGLIAGATTPEGWLDNFDEAEKLAKEKELPIVMLFTGSDWCPYCIKLKKEAIDTAKFKKEAPEKFVLLYLDFPRREKLPKNIQRQNEKLSDKYKVRGFPTTVVVNAKGKELGRLVGSRSAEEYLAELESFAAKDRKK